MKNLVILAIVLSLTATANAALTFVTDEAVPGWVDPGDTIRITFNDGGAVGAFGGLGDFLVNIDQDADILVPEVSWQNAGLEMLTGFIFTVNGDGIDVLVTGTAFAINPVGDIFYLDFKVADDAVDGDVITISHSSGSWNGVFPKVAPDVSLTVTPEPMTIALLGLGGLFLRRRK